MPVATTTTEGGRAVVSPAAKEIMNNATAERARKIAAAKRAADTLTPLTSMPTEQLPDPPALFPEPPPASDLAPQQTTLVLSVTILHRGRMITIASEGRSLDAFCDLLDKRFGVAS